MICLLYIPIFLFSSKTCGQIDILYKNYPNNQTNDGSIETIGNIRKRYVPKDPPNIYSPPIPFNPGPGNYGGTVYDIIANDPELSKFKAYVDYEGILKDFNDPYIQYTVIAPTNQAFAIALRFWPNLRVDNYFLKYHIIKRVLTKENILSSGNRSYETFGWGKVWVNVAPKYNLFFKNTENLLDNSHLFFNIPPYGGGYNNPQINQNPNMYQSGGPNIQYEPTQDTRNIGGFGNLGIGHQSYPGNSNYDCYVNSAKIINFGIPRGNGIVHKVDRILYPLGNTSTVRRFMEDGKFSDLSILNGLGIYDSILNALEREDTQFTVFLPSNKAFRGLPGGTNPNFYSRLFQAHIIPGKVLFTRQMAAGELFLTGLGQLSGQLKLYVQPRLIGGSPLPWLPPASFNSACDPKYGNPAMCNADRSYNPFPINSPSLNANPNLHNGQSHFNNPQNNDRQGSQGIYSTRFQDSLTPRPFDLNLNRYNLQPYPNSQDNSYRTNQNLGYGGSILAPQSQQRNRNYRSILDPSKDSFLNESDNENRNKKRTLTNYGENRNAREYPSLISDRRSSGAAITPSQGLRQLSYRVDSSRQNFGQNRPHYQSYGAETSNQYNDRLQQYAPGYDNSMNNPLYMPSGFQANSYDYLPLEYHVVSESRTIHDGIMEGSVYAKIETPDIPLANGVVHIIDNVLAFVHRSMIDFVNGHPDLRELRRLLNDNPEVQRILFQSSTHLTLFAPTDEAFKKIPPDVYKEKFKNNPKAFEQILKLHMVENRRVYTYSVNNDTEIQPMQEGERLKFTIYNHLSGYCSVKGGGVVSIISQPNIGVIKGVIHLIDSVMGIPYLNAFRYIQTYPQFSNAFQLITFAELSYEYDQNYGKFTYFIPSQEAIVQFKYQQPENFQKLIQYQTKMRYMLRNHILNYELYINERITEQLFENINKNRIKITVNPWTSEKTVTYGTSQARIIQSDIVVTNGLVHIIDNVLFVDSDIQNSAVTSLISLRMITWILMPIHIAYIIFKILL
ncbi:unnamed protein product [Gordionus sp. m RMFG-2023]